MTLQELKLKTIFCCMSCDGDIAEEEIAMVKKMTKETTMFEGMDTESLLNTYISEINKDGQSFLKQYLKDVANTEMNDDEQLEIVDLAIKTIEADNKIEYSEVKFFKKIRARLSLTDEQIMAKHPDKDDFLLPDINVMEDPMWDNVTFANITLN